MEVFFFVVVVVDDESDVPQRWRDVEAAERLGDGDDRREEISKEEIPSGVCSRVAVQFGLSVLPQWHLCGVWQ